MKSAKRIHQIGMTMFLFAVMALECESISLITAAAIGFTGSALMLASMNGMVLVAGLEGGALSAGQAALGLIPVCFLLLASFMRSGWYEPAERGEEK